MSDRNVRVCTRGVVRRGDELLVTREWETSEADSSYLQSSDAQSSDAEPFYSLLGGGVEFGEHSEDALHREFDEELGVTLDNVSYLETYEDVFSHDGERRHEVWRVYEADIVEDWPYEAESFEGYEPDESFECVWKPVADFRDGGETLYPEPVVENL